MPLTHWSSRGALLESGGAVLCASGTWIPVVANGAFRSDDTLNGSALVAAADGFFSGLQRGFAVKVRDSGEDEDLREACVEAGLELFGDPVPEMVCRAPLPQAPSVDGVTTRVLVDDEAGRARLHQCERRGLRDLRDATRGAGRCLRRPGAVLADPAASIVVARRDDTPVATAMVYESDGVASLQWVGTVPAERGTGLGPLVTVLATNLAFERGASSCSLQASPMGASVYRQARLRDDVPLRRVRALAQAGAASKPRTRRGRSLPWSAIA